ncbi:MAG: hypothetical protein IT383_25380, partial [Deltaproteobacteria bacterium]|nr:hypothetical protein [Deltaproteobacteria bacterium]
MKHALVLVALAALTSCFADRAELLAGKACDAEGSCASGYTCVDGLCLLDDDVPQTFDAGPSCDDGEARCFGDVPQTCDLGVFVDGNACPFVCVDGACAGSCRPGDASCVGRERVVCNEDGEYPASGALCDFTCSNGVCEGACVPDAQRCNGLVPESCDSGGIWVPGTACPYVCVDGACAGSCRPGDATCNARERLVCGDDGEFPASGTLCDFTCTNGVCEGACVPDTQRCNGLVPETCDASGLWVPATTCSGYCIEGACVACEPSTKRCAGDELQTCSAEGAWDGAIQTCEFLCNGVTLQCDGNCEPGHQACVGAVLETCPAGFLQQTTCDYVCNATSFECDGTCTPSDVGCNGDTPTLCSGAGAFEDQTPCGGGTPFCDDGGCVAPVIEGYATPFTVRSADSSASFVVARRVPLTTGTRAVKLGIYVRSSPGAEAVLGLYADGGGFPGNRLALTAPTVMVSGSQELPLLSEVAISGAEVWVAVTFSGTTGIG